MDNLSGYKLSKTLLHKMMQNSKKGGASSYEIDALIYMSMICDSEGCISQFRIKSLKEQLGCSERECYHIISSLEQKCLINVTTKKKNGHRDIVILHNNFKSKNFKQNPYLNTNLFIFVPGTEDNTQYWKTLSCGAKKLYLCLADAFHQKNGAKIGLRKICKKMNIKNENTIRSYFKELSPFMLQEQKTAKDTIIRINKENFFFIPNAGIEVHQPSYLKMRLERLFESAIKDGIQITEYVDTDNMYSPINPIKGINTSRMPYLIQDISNTLIYLLREKVVTLEESLGVLREVVYQEKMFSFKTIARLSRTAKYMIKRREEIGPIPTFSSLFLSGHYFYIG